MANQLLPRGHGRGAECVIIDPGLDAAAGVAELAAEHRLKPVAVMLTHGTWTTCSRSRPLCRANEAACWIHPHDRVLLADPFRSMGAETRALLHQLAPDHPASPSPTTSANCTTARWSRWPASTSSPCTRPATPRVRRCSGPTTTTPTIDSLVFSGDVLFAGSIGRTDLPGGNHADMLESLRTKVLPLPDPAVVLPGHGPQTTMARERAANPYLQDLQEMPA